jgi:uncharacterized membrane protein YphA (DoxX/SURF4 family)
MTTTGYTLFMFNIPLPLPELLDWAFWVPFFFRIMLAVLLLSEISRMRHGKNPSLISPNNTAPTPSARIGVLGILSLLSLFLILGMGTQIVGTVVACVMFFRVYQLMQVHSAENDTKRELLLLGALVALSLVFLGPGPYSIDLPL